MTILVTGAAGFVGSAVVARLRRDGVPVIQARRSGEAAEGTLIFDLCSEADQTERLRGVTVIIHCAARVHMMNDTAADPLARFREVNRDATLRLAEQAAAAGVRRFVFLSSIKVNGESTTDGQAFGPDDMPQPVDPYGVSKAEAEEGLRKIATATGLEVVIVRPPLVYGPGVRANFAALIGLVRKKLPLPLGAVTGNRRTMVALDNLVDFLVVCATSGKAANQTFLVGDAEDLSTAGLLRGLASALDIPVRLLPLPVSILRAGAAVLGRDAVAKRILGSLQLDTSKARTLLGWQPPLSVAEGLRRAVNQP